MHQKIRYHDLISPERIQGRLVLDCEELSAVYTADLRQQIEASNVLDVWVCQVPRSTDKEFCISEWLH